MAIPHLYPPPARAVRRTAEDRGIGPGSTYCEPHTHTVGAASERDRRG